MLDIKFINENTQLVIDAYANRSGSYDVMAAVNLDARRKEILKSVEGMKANRNKVSDQIALMKREKKNCDDLINEMKLDNEKIREWDVELSQVEAKLKDAMLTLPNVPDDSVPIGKTDADNKEVRKWGKPTTFNFEPKSHWDLGEQLKIFDWNAAAKITGSRFTVYRGLGAKLERAIYNFMLDTHSDSGYTEILPPFIVNRDSMTGTGQLPKFEEDAFALKDTNYFLVPTAEVPVTNLHRGEVINEDSLPIKYCAYTACFRAEAGSAGRDTRGLIRQHQFNKVELVKFCTPETSAQELEELTANAESILQLLGLPYRVVALCTGDTGFSSAKTYDIEVWLPSYNRYVEISSCSNFRDFQARRMNIKYKKANGSTAFLNTLNGSGLAVGRCTAAIIENFQQADGSVLVPKVLVPYMRTEVISCSK